VSGAARPKLGSLGAAAASVVCSSEHTIKAEKSHRGPQAFPAFCPRVTGTNSAQRDALWSAGRGRAAKGQGTIGAL
jgi:hypothetical protein